MNKINLFGKKYLDTIIVLDRVVQGETNKIYKQVKKIGGSKNLCDVKMNNYEFILTTSGTKNVYIISETNKSIRTSYVVNVSESKLDSKDLDEINKSYDWTHVCYLDDIECYNDLLKLKNNLSVDFCTDMPREKFIEVMKKAKIIFDSRERKNLYRNINLETPIIFHDEYGVEIIVNGKKVYSLNNYPLDDLEVNGAGDMFAAFFLDNYDKLGMQKSAEIAMIQTTEKLKNRNLNE